jgi:alanyl-tRNA synthetase
MMSDLEDEYQLDYFDEEGFVRTECSSCGSHFWSRDESRETCGEPPCASYDFVGSPGFSEPHSLAEMREAFLSFFEENGHERVDPYPVAANRWRDDVLLTQASVYDFQPLVTSGRAPPPANPLTISQPCIRMQDIDNVGKTGRHTMAFEMMAHHAFNARKEVDDSYAYSGEVYWKDQTVRYCDELLAEMGADPDLVTYIEDPWVGGGNAGPAIEVIYKGLELATLVFMSMERDPDGEYRLKDGNRYSKMDTYIVDTGYGLERWTWMSQGTPTVYEAVYPETIAFLKDHAGVDHTDEEATLIAEAAAMAGNLDVDDVDDIEAARSDIAAALAVDVDRLRELVEPLESIYAVADHCRTLAYMLGDGIVPSNVKTGYLARMVLRRTKRLVDEVGVDVPLDELVDMQAERLGYENRDTIREMVRAEEEQYRKTLERGSRRVESLAAEYADRDESLPTERLVELYDSHGIQPETVREIAAREGAAVEVPDDFYALVAARHGGGDDTVDSAVDDQAAEVADLPETDLLFYDDPSGMEFEAVVLDSFEREDGYDVVLDQTLFYPEGGGQPADVGTLRTDDDSLAVTDVQAVEGVVLHRTDGEASNGEIVRGSLDVERRQALMRAHTTTHLVGHAARQVLGDHIRQAGAQKGVESSRLDVRHFQRIDRDEAEEIERVANALVRQNIPVKQAWPDRNDAEAKHGFDIYQGGLPPGEQVRLITIGDDVQACAGTHVERTGDIGAVELLSTEPIQDGVERITFAAGDAAVKASQRVERALLEAADVFDVSPMEVPDTAARFFEEWKARGKEIDRLTEDLAAARAAGGDDGEEVEVGDATVVVRRLDAEADELRATANALADEGQVAVLGSGAGGSAQVVVGVPEGVPIDAGEAVARLSARLGGGGGGPPDFAQGGGPDVEALDEVLSDAADVLRGVRNA